MNVSTHSVELTVGSFLAVAVPDSTPSTSNAAHTTVVSRPAITYIVSARMQFRVETYPGNCLEVKVHSCRRLAAVIDIARVSAG